MRVPARQSAHATRGNPVSVTKYTPPPIGGWNARDPLAAMRPQDAVTLENWFPRVADVAIRGGASAHATGFASRPKTLATYNSPGGVNEMYAITDAGIFDVTSAGAIGASELARTDGYHLWTQMAVSGGAYLILCNGVDKPAYYDGTTWTAVDGVSTPALTGVTTTNLVFPCIYKRRLFFLEKSKLNFWYLAADAVGGALTQFLLGPLCPRGGYTMAMANWSFDGGNGPDDYVAFITSEGEVVVFTGTNPGDATAWTLVGVYYVGQPLGRRCFKKYGGDLVVLTTAGAFPMSKALQSTNIDYKLAMTNKIEGAFIEAAEIYGSNVGWTIEIHPIKSALLVNIPKTNGGVSAEQYVMNTTTKAWCKFTGWNASDFVEFNRTLYFADATTVTKAWTGFSDYGEDIVADAQTAFSNFQDARNKDFKLYRPIIRTNGPIDFSLGVAVDFEPNPGLSTASYTVVSGAQWDVSLWDQGIWAASLESILDWRTPGAKIGEWGAGLLRIATNSLEIQWAANDYLYEVAAVVT